MDRYYKDKTISEGAYGTMFKGIHNKKGTFAAIKKMKGKFYT